MRDRKNDRRRDTVRGASGRLQKSLAEDFQGGRVLPFDTVRRYYKDFKTTMRRSSSGEEIANANRLLAIAREQREILGWDVRPWQWVIGPEFFIALGGVYSQPDSEVLDDVYAARGL
jgi:hypothetical protein